MGVGFVSNAESGAPATISRQGTDKWLDKRGTVTSNWSGSHELSDEPVAESVQRTKPHPGGIISLMGEPWKTIVIPAVVTPIRHRKTISF